jgi:catechol-2,3-dioxygenase
MPKPGEKPVLDATNHEASLLEIHKWEAYPPDLHYTDGDGNDIEWVWDTASWQWLPDGYKVKADGTWVLK